MTTAIDNQRNIEYLNSFLRGEIAAWETYRRAERVIQSDDHRAVLRQCAKSHQKRIEILQHEVERRDGVAVHGSGLWGFFANTVESAASGIGEKAALSVLEEGETHGSNAYERDLSKLDPAALQLVESEILPEQTRTKAKLSELIQRASLH